MCMRLRPIHQAQSNHHGHSHSLEVHHVATHGLQLGVRDLLGEDHSVQRQAMQEELLMRNQSSPKRTNDYV